MIFLAKQLPNIADAFKMNWQTLIYIISGAVLLACITALGWHASGD